LQTRPRMTLACRTRAIKLAAIVASIG